MASRLRSWIRSRTSRLFKGEYYVARDFPWYEVVEGHDTLEQGDFINDCPAFVPDYETNPHVHPPSEGEESRIAGVWRTYHVVVLSQSCDLLDEKLENVLV